MIVMGKPVLKSVELSPRQPNFALGNRLDSFCLMCGGPFGTRNTVFAWEEWGVQQEIHFECIPKSFLSHSVPSMTGKCPRCEFCLQIECDIKNHAAVLEAQGAFLLRHSELSPGCTGCDG